MVPALCFVGAARFELATSWSQTRRDNRATLRPEYFKLRWGRDSNPRYRVTRTAV